MRFSRSFLNASASPGQTTTSSAKISVSKTVAQLRIMILLLRVVRLKVQAFGVFPASVSVVGEQWTRHTTLCLWPCAHSSSPGCLLRTSFKAMRPSPFVLDDLGWLWWRFFGRFRDFSAEVLLAIIDVEVALSLTSSFHLLKFLAQGMVAPLTFCALGCWFFWKVFHHLKFRSAVSFATIARYSVNSNRYIRFI
jgi:hypothetical protein